MYGTNRVRRRLTHLSPQLARTAVTNPRKSAYYARLWFDLNVRGRVPMPTYSPQQDTRMLFEDTPVADSLETYHAELTESDAILAGHRELSRLEFLPAAPRPRCIGLYALVRHYEPSVVLETGVFHGASTLYILEALRRNGHGHLHSIDVHPDSVDWWNPDVPDDFEPGWIVPEELRERWSLTLGKAQTELEPLLADIDPPDLFYHDSNHDYEHKTFEFQTVRDAMAGTGIISSHDVGRNNDASPCHAFQELCADLDRPYHSHRPFEPGDRGEGVFAYVQF